MEEEKRVRDGGCGGNKKANRKKASSSLWTLFTNADATDLWLMAFGVVAAVGDGLVAPVMFFISSKIFNNVGRSGPSTTPSFLTHTIKRNVLTILFLAACSLAASFLEGYCWTRTAERQTSRLRARYLKAILRQDVEYFDLKETSAADVVIGISSDSLVIQDFISEQLPNFMVSVSTFFGCYTVAFILVWRLALVASPSIILLVAPGVVYGRMLMGIGRKMRAEYAEAGTTVEQAVSSIRTVYSSGGEERAAAEYSSALDGSTESGLRLGLVKGIAVGGNDIMIAIWALIIWYGSKLVMYHGSQGGSVLAVGTSLNVGGKRLGLAVSSLKSFAEAMTAAEHVSEVMARSPKIDSDSTEGLIPEATALGEVEFRGVAFAYPSRPENRILSDFSLRVPTGKTVALVGGSGSGKSTAIALLERFYDPNDGQVLLDGTDIRRLGLRWLRSQMGLVSQEPLLFSMSVGENIMFGKEDASAEEVVAAAEAANVHHFIAQLPEGYETKVGEKGILMSGGQKQRIAIARAIIKSPKILLLDEATSALDSESEQVVQEALDKASAGRTTIVVAHRLSTIRNADMIAVVKAGRVAETGSHDDLMRNDDGLYSNLVLSQLNAATATKEQATVSVSSFACVDCVMAPSFKSKTKSMGAEEEGGGGDSKNWDKLDVHKPMPSLPRLSMLSASEWKHALFGCLGAIVVGGLVPFHVILVGNIVSLFFAQDHDVIISRTRTYSLLFIGMSVVSVSGGVAQHYNFGALGEYVTKRVRERTLSKILTFEVGWFDREENSTGAICARLAEDAYLVKSLVGDQVSLLVQTFSALAFTYGMGVAISWRMALMMAVVQPLVIVCVYSRKILLKEMSRKAREVQSDSSKFAAEAVSDLRTVTAFSSQDRILRFFQRAQDGPRRESIRQSWTAGVFLGVAQSLSQCTAAFVFWYGGKLVADGTITPRAFFQTYLVLNKTARIIGDAASKTNDLSKGAGAVRSVLELLDRPTLIEPEDPDGHRPEKLAGNVVFRGVDFAYPARPHSFVLEGFSLSVGAGKSTALVGRSGCGKSTVVGLVERFYDPVRGTVRIDDVDVKSYHLRSLRRHIALVGQQPTLFSGSVRENIMYGIQGKTEAEVEDAARVANAHGFISGLRNGYETRCGDRGLLLSGGQKQRIAIARAVLRDPSLLLLDEATSALDNESEKLVQEALEKVTAGRTCIVVAHRLSTVRDCDLIAVMDGGTVVETGTHNSLLEKGPGGSYHDLVKLQQARQPLN